MENVAQKVMKRIEGLEAKRKEEINSIQQSIEENKASLTEAQAKMELYTAQANLKAYRESKEKAAEASDALEMFTAKLAQLRGKRFISEKESDEVVDSLLAYEQELEKKYLRDISEPIKQLEEIHNAYKAAVREAETTLLTWTERIHSNYRSFSTTYADGTNRSKNPVPVRAIPYTGCGSSELVGKFLDKLDIADEQNNESRQ